MVRLSHVYYHMAYIIIWARTYITGEYFAWPLFFLPACQVSMFDTRLDGVWCLMSCLEHLEYPTDVVGRYPGYCKVNGTAIYCDMKGEAGVSAEGICIMIDQSTHYLLIDNPED